jgi:hypothetical protein
MIHFSLANKPRQWSPDHPSSPIGLASLKRKLRGSAIDPAKPHHAGNVCLWHFLDVIKAVVCSSR